MTVPQLSGRLLNTSEPGAAHSWDELLDLQVQLFLAHEVAHLEQSLAWREANAVMDAGCGNGTYISCLRSVFTRKRYLGLDVSPELVELARQRFEEPGLSFLNQDFFAANLPERVDYILFRFVLQYLRDPLAILQQSAQLLRPGGYVTFIEPDILASHAKPDLPLLRNMLHRLENVRQEQGRVRGSMGALAAKLRSAPGWQVVDEKQLRIPAIGRQAADLTAQAFLHWVSLCERCRAFDFPYENVRSEIAEWTQADCAFSCISLVVTTVRAEHAVH